MSEVLKTAPTETPVGVQTETPVVQQAQETPVQTPAAIPASTPSELEIDGIGKVKADEIKEWKLGYMRQSDYTRKTQEIAKSKQENAEALEVYNYLKSNPQIAQALANGNTAAVQNDPLLSKVANPYAKQFEDMNYKLAAIELDNQISALKVKYPDFDEVAILTEADKRNVTDLEFVYKAMQNDKAPVTKEQIMKEVREQIMREMQANNVATETLITGNNVTPQLEYGLTQDEKIIAGKMGLTLEQYAKGKGSI